MPVMHTNGGDLTNHVPVVPLVYMMVQRSSGLGGYGSGVGALRPFSNMSPHGVTDTPSDSIACVPSGV
eukprot:1152901-Pelagomonas_calceolata.AAC.16